MSFSVVRRFPDCYIFSLVYKKFQIYVKTLVLCKWISFDKPNRQYTCQIGIVMNIDLIKTYTCISYANNFFACLASRIIFDDSSNNNLSSQKIYSDIQPRTRSYSFSIFTNVSVKKHCHRVHYD